MKSYYKGITTAAKTEERLEARERARVDALTKKQAEAKALHEASEHMHRKKDVIKIYLQIFPAINFPKNPTFL